MLDKHITKAIIDVVIFLEFSDEKTLDPDAAIQTMEQLASELQLTSEETKFAFRKIVVELADQYGDKADFVREIPESLSI